MTTSSSHAFVVWALRDGVARRDGEHADEAAALRALA